MSDRSGSNARKPMIGIYDFSYGPYALGDALTWTMNLNVGAAAAGCDAIDQYLVIDPSRPGSRYQPFVNPHNYVSIIDNLFPAFLCSPMLRSLKLIRHRPTFNLFLLREVVRRRPMWPLLPQPSQQEAGFHFAPAHQRLLRQAWLPAVADGAARLWGLGGCVPPDSLRRPLRCRGEHPPGRVEPDAGEPVSRFAAAGMARLHPSRGRTPPRRAVSHPGRLHGVGPRGVSSAQRADPLVPWVSGWGMNWHSCIERTCSWAAPAASPPWRRSATSPM